MAAQCGNLPSSFNLLQDNKLWGIGEPSAKTIHVSEQEGSPTKLISTSQTIGAIMRGFMGSVTSEINKFRGTPGEKIWQVNYLDRIIRTEKAFHKISTYIKNNPKKWKG